MSLLTLNKLQYLDPWQQSPATTVEPQNISCSKTSTVPAERQIWHCGMVLGFITGQEHFRYQ